MLLQLGDQLIRNESIAVAELIKNSYDADAKYCKVSLRNIDNKTKGEIRITDDGIGMTPEVIEKVWLEPGADFKDQIIKGNQTQFTFAVTLPQRTPIGEKGIGRFGAHKLGDSIILVTKSRDSNEEVVINIDWKRFDQEIYLEDAHFEVASRAPERFKNGKTGTEIVISNIRKEWDAESYKELQRGLLSLISPFNESLDFQVLQRLSLEDKQKQATWTKSQFSIEDIKQKAMWKLDCVLAGERITKFMLEFNPLPNLDKLEKRVVGLDSLPSPKLTKRDGSKELPIDLNLHKIGPIKIQAYLFDLDQRILKLGFQDPKIFKDFMDLNGGVKVYKDNLRVYDYGEPGNDWLSLDKARINEPVRKIGNRNILAAVILDRKESKDLEEKTNREGFIEGKAYVAFKDAINCVVDLFARERNRDKERIRLLYEDNPSPQPATYEIDDLKDVIEGKLQNVDFEGKKEFAKEINTSLDRIKSQYLTSQRTLLKGAGAGLSLSVVMHEIDKRIKELIAIVKEDEIRIDHVKNSVQGISELVDNYSALVTSDRKRKVGIKTVIENAIFSSEFRFVAHKISLDKAFHGSPEQKISCRASMVVSMLINLFDNSIYWLNKYEIGEKKIFIDIKSYGNEEIGIIIADNGRGLGMDFEEAVQPFITSKVGGVGLGLYIVNEMMKNHGGKFVSRSYGEIGHIPEGFRQGAILELIFKI